MLGRIISLCRRYQFNRVCRQVRHTKPVIIPTDDSIIFVSLIYHAALDMTILALKSFVAKMPRGRLELIDDGSLTQQDYENLKHHFPGVNIVHITSINTGSCPTGGCWERLVHIINLSQYAYVVQVDTDTLSLGSLNEVWQRISDNQGFCIGNPQWPHRVSAEYVSHVVGTWQSKHVQTLSESQLDKLNTLSSKSYLRGCAAFAGFPKGGLSLSQLTAFSAEMVELIGNEKWHKWGTEQFASNVMLSLLPSADVLPWPKYQNYQQPLFASGKGKVDEYKGKVSLIHFIGSTRYNKGLYSRLARIVINSLR